VHRDCAAGGVRAYTQRNNTLWDISGRSRQLSNDGHKNSFMDAGPPAPTRQRVDLDSACDRRGHAAESWLLSAHRANDSDGFKRFA